MLCSLCVAAFGVVAAATGGTSAAPHPSAPTPEIRTTLRDHPIVGDRTMYLDGRDWTLSDHHSQHRIPATVPGDVISDLHNAGLIGNPLYELNWLNTSLWNRDWTYSKTFTIEEGMLGVLDGQTDGAQDALLVLDGVKMGATVTLNGVVLGTCTNQFLRYTHS